MQETPGRRTFLGALGGVCLGLLGLGACGGEGRPSSGVELTRPLIRPRGADDVWLSTPPDRRPVGYVSMATRKAFVDGAHRDRVSWLLDAHISVSTGLWRIPLPGDSPRMPIPPGDEAREFEELDISAWDPDTFPQEGDVRIVQGLPRLLVVEPGCHPIQQTGDWVAVDRVEANAWAAGAGEVAREDFRRLGSVRRHGNRGCTDGGRVVSLYGWAVRS